jgi:hypothetical protein
MREPPLKSHRTEDNVLLRGAPRQFYKGLASAIYSAIVSKPNWWDKITQTEIVAKWKQELLQQLQPGTAECGGLPSDSVSRLVDVIIASLARSRVGAVAADYGGMGEESRLVRHRPLRVRLDKDKGLGKVSIACACDCTVCCFDSSSDDAEEVRRKVKKPCRCVDKPPFYLHTLRQQFLDASTRVLSAPLAEDLRDKVAAVFQRLEDTQNPVDWHPGSNDTMQDLVHPSRCCAVPGVHVPADDDGLRWLPADVVVDAAGRVEKVVQPGFADCPDTETEAMLSRVLEQALPHMEAVIAAAAPAGSPHVVPLKGRTVQVIAKMATARLSEATTPFSAGSWHLEGVAAEQIIASAIYYPLSPGAATSGLSFRVAMPNHVPYPRDGVKYVELHYGFEVDEEREFETTCLLGTHPTRQDSMIVFPNNLQHQVGELKLLPGATEGRRRVLVLWLVAPGTRVPSTADVPDATLGSKISAAEALEYRELLMIERKYVVKDENIAFVRKVSLCEH